ncbi:MAG TPA: BON domain-containing protein [Phycisphaerales bacterium]|nr:BON domain-containing protein [Phycisphaerales bacterium]
MFKKSSNLRNSAGMLLAVGLGFAPVACEDRGTMNGTNNSTPGDATRDNRNAPANPNTSSNSRDANTPVNPSNTPVDPKADNTGRNERDRSGNTPTPPDQSQSQADLDITAEIRRAIMSDNTMSVNAQNCKIITQNGSVVLRGPVNTQAEKDAIGAKAKAVPGVTSVNNELEVKAG